jgi:integrase
VVADRLRRHLKTFRRAPELIEDETDQHRPTQRDADPVFTRGDGRPIHRPDWSYIWRPAVEAARLPAGYGLRDLRHYFATVLIFGGANVKTVQLANGPHDSDGDVEHLRPVIAAQSGCISGSS